MRVEVQELMTRNIRTCDRSESLASAAIRMWEADCGILPVVDDGRVVGVITDRDICMALVLEGVRATDRTVKEVSSGLLWSCAPNDDVVEALATMGRHRVRRLVVLEEGRLAGMLSMNDIVCCAGENTALRQPILATLESICAHRSLPVAA
ncbi:MAG: CBS domain-containing protein [Thermoanaerobaculia bacterium]